MSTTQIEPKPANVKPADDAAAKLAKAAEGKSAGVVGELWGMMMANKKWWLLPIIVALLLVGIVVIVGGSSLAPFIYTLF